MKNKRLDVVFVIDKSGSMSGSEDNTISSFNEYIERERKKNFHLFQQFYLVMIIIIYIIMWI